MKLFNPIATCLFILLCTAQLKGQSDVHEFKVHGGNLIIDDFAMAGNDTVYKKYERTVVVVEENDSIMYVEKFDGKRDWFVFRYQIKGGKLNLSGWQQEFDLNGIMLNERFCDFGQRECEVMKKYFYYPGGQLSSVVTYRGNHLDGYTYFYYNNGQMRQTIEYKDGKMWNVLVYYDQDGNVLDAGNFKDGTGTLNVYSMNGIMIQQKVFEKGKLRKKIDLSDE